jgi:hypothetical protein
MTGSLAPPPPYGSEQGSILLDSGREGSSNQTRHSWDPRHGRTRSGHYRGIGGGPTSPGPVRSPTDISLAQLTHVPSHEDLGEGTSGAASNSTAITAGGTAVVDAPATTGLGLEHQNQPPPEYSSPHSSEAGSRRSSAGDNDDEGAPLVRPQLSPPIPSDQDATSGEFARREQSQNDDGGNP